MPTQNTPRPCPHAAPVTPSDTVALTEPSRYLYVGTTGHITAVMDGDGAACLFSSIPAGTILPLVVRRVNATGTTASNIVAMW